MAVDAQRIKQLRDIAEREVASARYDAMRQRGLAEAAPDQQTRLAHERGAASYEELARQHQAVAAQRQAELTAAQGTELRQGLETDAEIATASQLEAERLAQEQRGADARATKVDQEALTKLEDELERYRSTRDRSRRRGLDR